eukprot:CAMPEP_0170580614 /NCGR_PEP_ID=MMETSP0224-20130122/6602_1 /TAXON_ID=285029 /ORGANISM="Togula jolla, Strain CCCM 725" /LENGTH=137 /DNA_ID=CAMNT_0010903699 /DNA_START=321 /DNA_END=736 /DNA_ORIENTATION=+
MAVAALPVPGRHLGRLWKVELTKASIAAQVLTLLEVEKNEVIDPGPPARVIPPVIAITATVAEDQHINKPVAAEVALTDGCVLKQYFPMKPPQRFGGIFGKWRISQAIGRQSPQQRQEGQETGEQQVQSEVGGVGAK